MRGSGGWRLAAGGWGLGLRLERSAAFSRIRSSAAAFAKASASLAEARQIDSERRRGLLACRVGQTLRSALRQTLRATLRAAERLRREIPFPRPHGEVGRRANRQVVHLAVELLRREPQRVLTMKLVGDAREGRRRDLSPTSARSSHRRWPPRSSAALRPASPTCGRSTDCGRRSADRNRSPRAPRSGVRPRRLRHAGSPASPMAYTMTSCSSARFITSFSDVLRLLKFSGMSTPSVKTRMTRRPVSRSRLSMPISTAFHNGVGPSVCRSVRRIFKQRVMVGRELRWIDLDASRKAADPRLVGRAHRADERFGRLLLEIEIRLHAAAAIEQHDDGDWLHVVGKHRQHLPLAIVVDREIVSRQVGDQPARRVRDGRVHGDGARRGGERRLRRLLSGDRRAKRRRAERGEDRRGSAHGAPASEGDNLMHREDSFHADPSHSPGLAPRHSNAHSAWTKSKLQTQM